MYLFHYPSSDSVHIFLQFHIPCVIKAVLSFSTLEMERSAGPSAGKPAADKHSPAAIGLHGTLCPPDVNHPALSWFVAAPLSTLERKIAGREIAESIFLE